MPTDALINPPATYPAWVWLLGLVLIVAGLAGPLAVVLAGRRRAAAYGIEMVREDALRDLAAVETAHGSGELPAADAYARIAGIVTEFAGTVTDTPVEALTLTELRREAEASPALEPVAALVAEVYPLAYAGAPGRSVGEVAHDARTVVQAWK